MKKQFTIFLVLVFVLGLVPINFSNAQDLSNKLSGRILLQVEGVGQAWYIDPGTKQRAFLGRPADAFQIMRELGLGISEKDYNSFNGFASKNLSGRILLRVEANGEAYYVNPTDLKMYYLGRPADAFKVMREKGLGITDEDLTTVPVFQKYKEQTEANTTAINSLNQKVEEQQKKISELEGKINTNASTNTDSCIADIWSCGTWSECSSGGQQTRVCNLTYDCQSVNTPSPSISQSCSYSSNNACTSWTYSSWGTCSTNGQQTRTAISSLPSGCTGGAPILNQSCVHTPPTFILSKANNWGGQNFPDPITTPQAKTHIASFILTSNSSFNLNNIAATFTSSDKLSNVYLTYNYNGKSETSAIKLSVNSDILNNQWTFSNTPTTFTPSTGSSGFYIDVYADVPAGIGTTQVTMQVSGATRSGQSLISDIVAGQIITEAPAPTMTLSYTPVNFSDGYRVAPQMGALIGNFVLKGDVYRDIRLNSISATFTYSSSLSNVYLICDIDDWRGVFRIINTHDSDIKASVNSEVLGNQWSVPALLSKIGDISGMNRLANELQIQIRADIQAGIDSTQVTMQATGTDANSGQAVYSNILPGQINYFTK